MNLELPTEKENEEEGLQFLR